MVETRSRDLNTRSDWLRQVVRDSEVAYTAELPGPPTTLQLFYNDGGEHGDQVPGHRRK